MLLLDDLSDAAAPEKRHTSDILSKVSLKDIS